MTNLATSDEQVLPQAGIAKQAAGVLAMASLEQRNNGLLSAAEAIEKGESRILQANKEDVTEAQRQVDAGELAPSLLSRLKLDAAKLRGITAGIRQVAALPDPLGNISYATELDSGLELFRVACPIGLIAVIFESRPDALPQIASLCLKSGNAVILKGGREAIKTNAALFACIRQGYDSAGIPADCIMLLDSRRAVESLLNAEEHVDLIIPRGSNQLVRHIQENTRIPVLGHAEGICHVYVHETADLDKAVRITVDSKAQYPSACNAVETLLVHKAVAAEFLPKVVAALIKEKVEIRCEDAGAQLLPEELRQQTKPAVAADWSTEYCELILSIKVIETLGAAIDHINRFGSHHTESIVCEDRESFDRFFAAVNSAGVYQNASTRFADGFRYGFGAEVGISTGKLHPRGPVGLDGLVTYKYKLQGNGQVVADYVGDNAKQFSHRSLDKNES